MQHPVNLCAFSFKLFVYMYFYWAATKWILLWNTAGVLVCFFGLCLREALHKVNGSVPRVFWLFDQWDNTRKDSGDRRNPAVPVVLCMPWFLNGNQIFQKGNRGSRQTGLFSLKTCYNKWWFSLKQWKKERNTWILGYIKDSNAAAHSVDTGIS